MAQKPLPPPETSPAMKWNDRVELTKKHLATHIKALPAPPADFEPLKATNEELIKAGLPESPDPKSQPGLYAKWKAVMSKPLTHVPCTFTPITKPRDTLPRNASITPSNTYNSGNWSGAVAQSLIAGDSFKSVSGSWTVPNAYPPASAKLPSGAYQDGTYWCSSWVGIDGWGSPDVLQAGTDTYCVVSGGVVTSQAALGWQEWYPFVPTVFDGFAVKPGDVINCLVCSTNGAGSTTGAAFLHNTSTGAFASAQLKAPPGTTLVANCAEWILEDPGQPSVPFPDYGADFFYDCQAGTVNNAEQNLSAATAIDMLQGGKTLSTAVVETNTLLMTYYPGSGP